MSPWVDDVVTVPYSTYMTNINRTEATTMTSTTLWIDEREITRLEGKVADAWTRFAESTDDVTTRIADIDIQFFSELLAIEKGEYDGVDALSAENAPPEEFADLDLEGEVAEDFLVA